MVKTLETKRAEPDGAGTLSGQFRLQPPGGRRVRVPELALGAAMMVGFALVAVLWHMSTTERDPALALAKPVQRGEVIEAADLRVVYVSADEPIARLGRNDAAALVGRTALSDLPVGALLTEGSVAPRIAIGAGQGVVGLALEPGQAPAGQLVPGDLVNVIGGAPERAGSVEAEGRPTAVLASAAEVYGVEDLPQGRRLVSLKLAEPDANRVAAAAQRGPVRLVLVGR